MRRNIRQEGRRVIVRTPDLTRPRSIFSFGRGPRVDYQLTVPRATAVRISGRSGSIECAELDGNVDIQSRSGRVTMHEIKGAVAIASASGSVQVERIGGALSIDSRSGSVRVRECGGNAQIKARSGTLQVDEIGGDLQVDSRSGTAALSDVRGGLTLKSRSGSVRYEGGVGGPFDIDVMSGSVRLGLDRNSVFKLDASAVTGSITSDFPVRKSPPSGAKPSAAPSVRIRALSGSIHIGQR
jgi:DUF4097 and DUF4098 domain-containing protein YvlB